MGILSRTDQGIVSNWFWTIDRTMLVLIACLIAYSLVLVSAASPAVATRIGLPESHFLIRHIIIMVVSVVGMLLVSFLSPKGLWRLATIVMGLGVFALILVPFIGMEIKGAQRWIHFPGISLQPSELVKPAFAIVVARLIALQKESGSFPGELWAIALYVVIVFLLMVQPDFGMTFVITCIAMTQIFLAGFRFKYLAFVVFGGIVALFLVYSSFGHVQSRVDRFLNPESGDNFQVEKSLESFRAGGLMGQGPGQGQVKLRLPDAHADFIFAVSGEELGFIFTLILSGLYLLIVLHGLRKILDSEDFFTILACGGLLAMIGLQALIHMGSSLHILPAKGMTLPFISYGGTSLLSVGFTMGAVLSLTRYKKRKAIVKSRSV